MPERKPRQRITFAQRLAKLDERLKRAKALTDSIEIQRDDLIEQHKAKAETMLKEAGVE